MMEDDNIGKEGPGHFTERGDEEGEDSDSGGSNVEEEHVRPYEHDPSFKSKEELEHFLKGCDNRIESESDSEDENVECWECFFWPRFLVGGVGVCVESAQY